MSVFRLTHVHSVFYGLSNALFFYLKNYIGAPAEKWTSESKLASKNTMRNKI